MTLDLTQHIARQMAFSRGTFGPGPRTAGVVAHIAKELQEVTEAAEKSQVEASREWVDVVILALDGLTRSLAASFAWEMVPSLAAAMIAEKQGVNEQRNWPDWRGMTEDQPIEHDRSGEAAQNGQ